jgi:iron complex outermembrane receptor protein
MPSECRITIKLPMVTNMVKTTPALALALALALLTPLVASVAYAQEQAEPAASEATAKPRPQREERLVLEEILVTANRRVESLQEVPMSVSAFGSDFFKDTGVTNLAGLEQYTPSLKITPGTDSRSTSIRIRGIGSVGTNVGIDPSVGMFIDGVYQGRAGMSVGDLVDIERIEVLRGPQGTLYGKNTAAGAISIITKAPSYEFESEVELTYNTDERAEVHGMVNIPLGDSPHAVRLTGFGVDGDHLFDNTATGKGTNDASKWGVKSRGLFDTSASGFGEFLLTADYTKENTDCCALAVSDYDGLSTLNAPITNNPSAALSERLGDNAAGERILKYVAFEDTEGFAPPKPDPFGDDYWFDGDVYNKVEVGGIALEWNQDLDSDDTLTFINAWRHYESDSAYDGDFTAYNAVQGTTDIDLDQYSSEFRITSPGGETFDYQGGLYAYYSEVDSIGEFFQSQSLVENIGLDILFPEGSLNIDTNTYKTTSYAAFGQLTWNINDQLSTTLGLRYTYEKKEREGTQITEGVNPKFDDGSGSPVDLPPIAGPNLVYDENRSDDDISPTINVRYFFTPELMTYASISRGFKSGGFNQRREAQGLTGEFDEETATNYELGWKISTEDRRLQFNGTFYFVNYDDFQAQAFDGSSIRVTNAGSMESYGTELELVYIPLANLTLGNALGYNKAEYKDFDNGQCTVDQTFYEYYIVDGAQGGAPGLNINGLCVQDLAGKALDNAPEWTVSSYAQYDMDLTEDLVGVIRLEHSYIDDFYLDQDLDEKLKNDEVNLVNLRFTLTNNDNSWEAAVWGRNMLDEDYYVFGIDIPVLGGYAGVTAPGAIYGVTLRFRN